MVTPDIANGLNKLQKIFKWSTTMNTLNTFAAPTGRLLLAMMFLMSGLSKIGNYAGTPMASI